MRKIGIVLAAALALSASACSSDEPDDTTDTTSIFSVVLDDDRPQPIITPPTDAVIETVAEPADEPAGDTVTTPVALPAEETEPEIVPEAAPPALTSDSTVTLRALGPVRIGMSVEEASAAAGLELRRDLGRASTDSCHYVNAGPTMRGVSFMVVNDLIRRIDIDPPSPAATRSGVRIGTAEGDLREVYPDNIQRADSAVTGARGWAFVPNDDSDADFRIYFEVEDGSVSRYRLGSRPSVDSLSGCE